MKKKINILFFSTGNEISNLDNIPDWKVRNSNNHYIKNLDQNFLFNFKNGGILKDNHEKIFKSKINKMFKSNTDIILTSGAVSVGKFDFVPNVIKSFKLSNYFKGVAIRPGKPILFAKIKGKQKAIFGLPGNPMSSAACFRFFVFPYIEYILGLKEEKPFKAILKNNFTKKKNFTRFAKSKLNTTKNGKIEVEILQGQESFRIKLKNKLSKRLLPISAIDGKLTEGESIYYNENEIGKVLIEKEYPFALIKYLDENFNGKSDFNTKEASIKIEKPDWIKN